jgi:UDP-N-acetylmuramoyl-tripeptide--D-alanyl-D-alanine ligase
LIRTKLAGDYNLYNVLLAFSIGRYFEIDAVKIVQALESYQPSNSRSQIIKSGDTTIILDAYNANPSSMEVALFNLAKFEGKRIAILGAMKEMGNHSEEEHKNILELALNLNINIIVAIGIEFSEVISSKTIQYFETTEEAKNWYKQQKFGRDTILIKGSRGMALEKILE